MPFFDLNKKPDGMSPPPPPPGPTSTPTPGPTTPPNPAVPNTTPSNPAAASSSSTTNTNPAALDKSQILGETVQRTVETAVDVAVGTPAQIADVVGNPERRVVERVAQAAIDVITEDVLEAPEAAAAPAIDEPLIDTAEVEVEEAQAVVEQPANGGAGADPVAIDPATSSVMTQQILENTLGLTGDSIVRVDVATNTVYFKSGKSIEITFENLALFTDLITTSEINFIQNYLNETRRVTRLQSSVLDNISALKTIMKNNIQKFIENKRF